MRGRWRLRAAMAGLVGILVGAVSVGPAAAGTFGQGQHTRTGVGYHWLLDGPGPEPELPAVVCTYGGPDHELQSMLIRQPVMLADVSEGARTQTVGWRAEIQRADSQGGPWSTYVYTPSTPAKATATGKLAASFAPHTYTFPSNVEQHDYYRVVYRLLWYGPNGTSLTGEARHWPWWYGVKGAGFAQEAACRSTDAPVVAGGDAYGEGAHTGKRGLHWILDHIGPYPELPAVTCEYDAQSKLDRIIVRRPMVLARDTGPGTNRQDVAWRAVLQASLTNSTTETWFTVSETTLTRKSATDKTWAEFTPKVIDVDPGDGQIVFRIVYRLYWYKGTTNQVIGRATHWPLWYKVAFDGGLATWHEQLCYADGSG